MKVKFWTYVENCGDDSSAEVYFFPSKAAAKAYAFNEGKNCAYNKERRCGDICERNLEFDEDGNFVKDFDE